VFEDVYGGGLGWAAVSGRRAGLAAVAHTTAGKASAPLQPS
jgi:hypothetical protein